ncbi:type II secretion system minor pseudopilin GspI [Sandarakinorhabdus sp.]|uniref:type II secretion system minor pseudopilin GspI n=1 Tax=Sandarakinorhabdus sp. TaxID=1916663 RepID=UPI003F726E7A
MPARANGFSLIEVMVALAIFGMAAVALVRLSGLSLSGAVQLADRQYAATVARNQTLEAILSPTPPAADQGRERAGQRDWAWQRRVVAGPVPGTQLVIVDVRGDAGQIIASDQLLWSGR